MNSKLEPFHIVYDDVRQEIVLALPQMPDAGGKWVDRVNKEFWQAFGLWFQPPYTTYEASFNKLTHPVMQLAAAAYLHISYDLPCVLSRNLSPLVGITEAEAEASYFSLETIFRKTVVRAARNTKVVGAWGCLAKIVPSNLLKTLVFWMMYLRTTAWIHGRFLATLSENEQDIRQTAILTAVTDALNDLIGSGHKWPWNIGNIEKLRPPHRSVYSFLFPLCMMFMVGVVSFHILFWIAASAIGVGILAVVLSAIRRWLRRKVESEEFFRPAPIIKDITKIFLYDDVVRHREETAMLAEFVDQLGWFTSQYVNAAVRNPESYDAFRQRFLVDNGVPGTSTDL